MNAPSSVVVLTFTRTLKLGGRQAQLLEILSKVIAADSLTDLFIEDESQLLELLEPLACMSFRGKQPRNRQDWKTKAEQLSDLLEGGNDMGEKDVIRKARRFLKDVGMVTIPVDVKRLASAANATIKPRNDMDNNESGQTFQIKGKHTILVNGKHKIERQRFTILHEVAHIVLGLPSQHNGSNSGKRPREEQLCDLFAAECLLPYSHFIKDIKGLSISLANIKDLASRYQASIIPTSSRFAKHCEDPCAFILMRGEKIDNVSRSPKLEELKGWIGARQPIPKNSVARRLLDDNDAKEPAKDRLPVDTWFDRPKVGDFKWLVEEAMPLKKWDQYLSLISFDYDPRSEDWHSYEDPEGGEPLLEPLDGNLRWTGNE